MPTAPISAPTPNAIGSSQARSSIEFGERPGRASIN
jgi:hypothetical protein